VVYYTSSTGTTLGLYPGYGGTSFAAPQLNGVMALIGESLRSRVGFLNFPLYDLVRSGQAYGDDDAPLRAIKYGDNWFYHGSDGYNLGAGVGTMNVAKFADVLRDLR
jgi:subtilase family serine protease